MINTRRSCRKYRKEQITDEELNAILEAGTYAPTGMGQQSPYIVAVQNPEMKAQLERMNAAVRGLSGNPYYDAPTYILVFAPLDCRFAIQDGTCVLENMMLAAHALGVSSCWINREIEMFATEEGKQLMKRWGCPMVWVALELFRSVMQLWNRQSLSQGKRVMPELSAKTDSLTENKCLN